MKSLLEQVSKPGISTRAKIMAAIPLCLSNMSQIASRFIVAVVLLFCRFRIETILLGFMIHIILTFVILILGESGQDCASWKCFTNYGALFVSATGRIIIHMYELNFILFLNTRKKDFFLFLGRYFSFLFILSKIFNLHIQCIFNTIC